MSQGAVTRIGRFPVQTPLGARPGLAAQPRYEDPGDPWVKVDKKAVINIGVVRLSL